MQWQHRSWAGFQANRYLVLFANRYLVLLWNVRDTLDGQICICWQIQHMDYMGPFWSNGWRAEVWLSTVPNMALSSSPVARKGHLGELVLPGQCWVPQTWMQPSLHRHLGGATAPKVMLGTKRSPAAFSSKHKPELSKCCLLSKMTMLCSRRPPTHENTMESSTGKANKPPLCKRKPAISIVTKPQLGTGSFSQTFLLHQETKWRPRFSH